MSMSFATLVGMARDTLTDPQGVARQVLALPFPRALWWQALVVLVVLSLLITQGVSYLLIGPVSDPVMGQLTADPLKTAAVQIGLAAGMAIAMHRVGRLAGGTGDFDGALRMTVWLHFVVFGLQLLQTVLLLVLPFVANLAGLVIMGLAMWVLTNLVAALHGFSRLLPVFLGIFAVFFVVALFLYPLLSLLGLGFPMESPNV